MRNGQIGADDEVVISYFLNVFQEKRSRRGWIRTNVWTLRWELLEHWNTYTPTRYISKQHNDMICKHCFFVMKYVSFCVDFKTRYTIELSDLFWNQTSWCSYRRISRVQ